MTDTHQQPKVTSDGLHRVGDREHAVAVTGVAIICSLGDDTATVWRGIRHGDSGIGHTRQFDVSSLGCQLSAEFIHTPSGPDKASTLAIHVASEALRFSGLSLESIAPHRRGIGLGTSVGGLEQGERWQAQLLSAGPEATNTELLRTYPLYSSADAVASEFDLKGPKVVISNACAAGGNAIGWAADQIRLGRADVMLAGGVDVLDILSLAGFDSLKALDPLPCAPLSRSTGLNLGEGAAVLVLESEDQVRKRSALPLAWFRGYGLSSDAHHATAPDPSGNGALRSMSRALERSELTPGDVGYLNMHGTGTPANDSAEPHAVTSLFGERPPPHSSTKSQVGHTLGAAGAVEAGVTVLALRDGVLPPTINVDPALVNPGHDIVPNTARQQEIENALSNSFAFGGNNCSLVFSRHPGRAADRRRRRVVVTGAGQISGLGVGPAQLWESAGTATNAMDVAPTVDLTMSRLQRAAGIKGDYGRWIDRTYRRRVDQIGALVLAVSRMAVEDADVAPQRVGSDRVGMTFGTFTGPLETVGALSEVITSRGPHHVSPRMFPNSVVNAAAGHACLALQLRGPLSTLASGCCAGLQGMQYAADLIADGEADVMLAVSADELTKELHLGYDRLGVLGTGEHGVYSRRSDGLIPGAGAAALVLEDLEHAQARGARIYAEVLSSAVTSDAGQMAANDPRGRAWAKSMRLVMDGAGVSEHQVAGVYGDARGTRQLDLAELHAISHAFPEGTVLANLGSQTGHLGSTTAMLSAITALRTVGTGWMPAVRQGASPSPLPAARNHHLDGLVEGERRHVMVTAANWGGTYATVLLGPVGP